MNPNIYAIIPGQIWNGRDTTCKPGNAIVIENDRIDRIIDRVRESVPAAN